MRNRVAGLLGAALAIVLASGPLLRAAEVRPTVLTVEGMHCAGCAKKIAGKLTAVSGVAQVEANVPKSFFVVTPAERQAPSPKALWEAVEKAGYTAVKLEGPSGVYTKKPKS
ncbi:MAG TPA: heavy-metal-associated domain-containing protein [Pirellulales bacterium]|nr:heavy-metal-associated domain-containing protein [Pirellulales bacterium]